MAKVKLCANDEFYIVEALKKIREFKDTESLLGAYVQ